jgi:hypothetical protein
MVMEVVNRRNFNEDFPVFLFFIMWFNLFAISLILLPIVQGRRAGDSDLANTVTAQGNTLLTNPRSAAAISVLLLLSTVIVGLLGTLGWAPLDRLINGPDPEQAYLPGLFISIGILSVPVAAGIIAGVPVARTLRAGGSLFAHPVNLVVIVLILSPIAVGLFSLIVDQWPCFIGVPVCD